MTEPNKPLDQMTAQERYDLGTYAQAQLGLGAAYYAQNKIDQAIKTWSSIPHDDDPKTYARAQFNLGLAYDDLGKSKQAIKTWSKVRHGDDPKAYAKAQFNLGLAYKNQDELEQAIKTWSNISHNDAPKTYARAQFNIGNTYDDLGKLEQAIKTWSNISHNDAPKTYAQAQFNLGLAYKNQDELDEAITTWSKIRREEAGSKTYARAQLNLGAAYAKSGELDEAITAWSKVRHDDDPETYARAQFNLGLAYKNQDELDEAITIWSKIRREEAGSETYAWAQLNLGAAYNASNKPDQAITVLSKIRREEADPETYARAQLNLGLAYKSLGKLEQAIEAWSKIRREEADPETYVEAQLGLGEVYSLDKEKEEQAHKAYNNVRDFSYYKFERGFKILNCPLEVREDLHSLAKNTDEILKSLQIIPEFESKVAHYSRSSTAFKLFGDEKNDKDPSHFRLSTIRGVNDPTEGLVLSNYWDQQGIPETTHTNDTATFVSCFTFNHDSLNQFRLYGKEDGREATGVSLVFKKEFFSKHSGALKYIAGGSSGPSNNSGENESDEAGKLESDNKKKIIGKSTLYRCIYLDPETGYWTLAQRDKSTFYRHYKEKAEKKWKAYYMLILIKEKKVEKHLFNKENNDNNSVSNENNKIKSISQVLNLIFTDKNHIYNECDKDKKQKILEVIRFILLPLQYLVKHIAFQEEQECRIMYTTHLHDKKIHHDWEKQWMYVEYKERVLPHIDKIWLSPGAAKDQDFFRILLDKEDNDDKVRISQNPFRNKE